MDEVFNDPQTQHLGIAVPVKHPELGDIKVVGQPVGLSRTPSEIRTATPARGADTDALMREFGYSDESIIDFRQRLII
jgi:formyl-CoA transferase